MRRPDALGEHQHVEGAHDVRLDRLDRVVLVVHRRRGAGQVVDLVDLGEERLADVVPQQLEARMVEQVLDVVPPAGEEVVQADDVVALGQQPVAEMRADEAGAAGDEDSHGVNVSWSGAPASRRR